MRNCQSHSAMPSTGRDKDLLPSAVVKDDRISWHISSQDEVCSSFASNLVSLVDKRCTRVSQENPMVPKSLALELHRGPLTPHKLDSPSGQLRSQIEIFVLNCGEIFQFGLKLL